MALTAVSELINDTLRLYGWSLSIAGKTGAERGAWREAATPILQGHIH